MRELIRLQPNLPPETPLAPAETTLRPSPPPHPAGTRPRAGRGTTRADGDVPVRRATAAAPAAGPAGHALERHLDRRPAGAVLGAGLTYLAANWIALPQQAPPFDDPAPALADRDAAAAELDARLAALEDLIRNTRIASTPPWRSSTRRPASCAGRSPMSRRDPEPQTVDLSAIERAANARKPRRRHRRRRLVRRRGGAAAPFRHGESLATLAGGLDGLESRLAEGDGRAATLAAGLEEARAAIAAQTRSLGGADIGPAVKLPLIVSGLEAAFAGGRSYAAELDGLTTLLPDLAVPEVIAASAATGLARPDALAARFTAALPDIIAGRARETTGDWAQDAIEWAKALLALRPAEEIEGDTPEAVISRLEAAVGRRDFVAAAALLAQLPAPMRQAAGAVGTDIAALAQAETFIVRLRAQALAPATEPAS